jgi:hypothetical protein
MYTIGLITTNHPKRFDVLLKTINSFDKEQTKDIKKILSVDKFPTIKTDFSFFKKIQEMGWSVVYKEHTGKNSMVTNQQNLLSFVETEWLLYCEDDVVLRDIPPVDTLKKMLTQETGFVSLNAHVHEFPNISTIQYCRKNENYNNVDDFCLLKKNKETFQHKWYFNFPSCFVRKQDLKFILEDATNNYCNSHYSIEEGLSYSWLLNKESQYSNYIILKNPNLQKKDILQEIHDSAILSYWNNDLTTRIEPVNKKASMWF